MIRLYAFVMGILQKSNQNFFGLFMAGSSAIKTFFVTMRGTAESISEIKK